MTPHVLGFLPLLFGPLGSGSTIVAFSDETFLDADWQTTDVAANGVATAEAQQVLEGNPAPARRVTHEFLSGSGLYSVWGRHLMSAAVYDPATGGPVDAVSYALDSQAVQGTQRLNWALEQDGRFYVAPGPTTAPTWATHEALALVAEDFREKLADGSTDPASHPDFSSSGGAITFGFQTHNGGSTGAKRIVDYDNYWVEVSGVPSAAVVRSGSPPNPDALLPGSTPGPVVGETWDPVIDHSSFLPGATTDVAFYSTMSANVPTDFGTLLCAGTFYVHCVPAGTPFAFEVPDSLSLIGAEFCLQGGAVDPSGGSLLTNALDVTVGHF